MEPLAAAIFIGIPLVGLVFGLMSAASVVLRWGTVERPATHYIAARMAALPVAPADRPWLEELDALRLPYRHLIC